MRSLIWTSVCMILVAEIALTALLVIPVPRAWRNAVCLEVSKFNVKHRLKLPLAFLVIGISLAFLDALNYLLYLWDVEEEDVRFRAYRSVDDAHVVRHLVKERVYKTQRNLYLSGFAVTLLFVIGRLTDLMQEHADLEKELEKKRQASLPAVDASTGDESKGKTEIEMKPMQSKKNE
ncbi:B-cell receptor-associated protein 31-like protein [Nitzschia inconspicua]|uniref:Endoplasmic reticulum transmembrane protein n=1 Tax=Nitzschia inconspicua TaxID=303405 RepID=A0A9K3Q495_9STRA|nr:B-cell receptor-associated protein 31-like protein [Nitzschia inconspicua]